MVAMHQLAALCIAATTLAFVPPQGHKPSHRMRAAPEGADLEETVTEKEAALAGLCKALGDALQAQPLLLAQVPPGQRADVTAHTLLEHLGRLESLVVRLVGKRVAAQAAEAKAARLQAEKEAEEAFFAAPAASGEEGLLRLLLRL